MAGQAATSDFTIIWILYLTMKVTYTILIRIPQWRLIVIVIELNWNEQTHPFVDVHLQCVVVEREEICVRAAGFITRFILQPGTQTQDECCVLLLFHHEQPRLQQHSIKRSGFLL